MCRRELWHLPLGCWAGVEARHRQRLPLPLLTFVWDILHEQSLLSYSAHEMHASSAHAATVVNEAANMNKKLAARRRWSCDAENNVITPRSELALLRDCRLLCRAHLHSHTTGFVTLFAASMTSVPEGDHSGSTHYCVPGRTCLGLCRR